METTDHTTEAQRVADELAATVARIRRMLEHNKTTAAENVEEELREQPLCVDTITTYRVTLGTGGPAYGVDFTPTGATVWFQDWFTGRTHVELDDDTANMLAVTWFVGYDDETGGTWTVA